MHVSEAISEAEYHDMVIIPLTQDKFTIIDKEDYEIVRGYAWHALDCGHTFYAVTNNGKYNGKQGKIRMHTLIMKPPAWFEVDHKYGNGLDNTRADMEVVDHSQNMLNQRIHRSGHLPGTTYSKRDGRWISQIRVDGIMRHLGQFNTPEEAHQRYLKEFYERVQETDAKLRLKDINDRTNSSSHMFTSKLVAGDIVVSEYGTRYTEAIWGGTWYTHFSQHDIDRVASHNGYTLINIVGTHKIYRNLV